MAISNGVWPFNLSVESLVLREIVPIAGAPCGLWWISGGREPGAAQRHSAQRTATPRPEAKRHS
jgi:hypothetical protein